MDSEPEGIFTKLKRSLKKWEKSFVVDNGRNPTKEDIQNASSEIQDLYQEYRLAKKHLHGHQQKLDSVESVNIKEKVTHNGKASGRTLNSEIGVFGMSLNKKQAETTSNGARVKSKTWKLPPMSNATNIRSKPWKYPSVPPAPASARRESRVENSSGDATNVRVGKDRQCVSSTPERLQNPPPLLSQNRLQLKYESVSLSVLEKCDVESAISVKGENAASRERPVRQSMSGSGISRRDSCLARILGGGCEVEETESTGFTEEFSTSVKNFDFSQGECRTDVTRVSPDIIKIPHHSASQLAAAPCLHPLPSHSDELDEPASKRDNEVSVISPTLPDEMESDRDEVTEASQGYTDFAASQPETRSIGECSGALMVADGLSASVEVRTNELATDNSDESSDRENDRCESRKQGGGISKKSGGVGGGSAISENFMKLNMKVKRYTRRPGRGLTGERYKRMEWKKRQKEINGSSSGRERGVTKFVCFKCGETGHWARNCKGKAGFANLGNFDGQAVEYSELTAEEQMDLSALEELEKASPYPTIDEALKMAAGEKVERRMIVESAEEGEKGEEEEEGAECGRIQHVSPGVIESDDPYPFHSGVRDDRPCPKVVEPLLKWEPGTSEPTPSYVLEALEVLGFSSFRPCQREVVMRILSGKSSLMITATGSGKSLCYQLPAYLYRKNGRGTCFTLVVSPLVSLMDDQVLRLPLGLKGACLHTNKTQLQRERVLQDLVQGKVDILYLSPEALVGGVLWSGRRKGWGSGCGLEKLPPIAFACIDEVHCISEWSHNFRPSYLRLHKTLRTYLGVKCVLGLTATATHTTGVGVARQLGVADEDVVWGAAMPTNLHISVSRDQDRDLALVELLSHEPYRSLDSIIIYCTRQQTTEGVAQMLRTALQSWNQNENTKHSEESESTENQNSANKGGKKVDKRKGARCYGKGRKKQRCGAAILAESYHAGMSASQRRSVQNKFMRGDLRIVVATVAFGMGLDKCDVRAVIHYNMPQSMEAYVQEVGRAGRDGNPAYCHTFIDQEARDLSEMRRNIYANFVDLYALKKFVEKVFPNSTGAGTNMDVAVDIEEAVENLDVTRECLETLLCYLELSGKVRLKGSVKDQCTVKCYGGDQQVKQLSWKVPAMAAAVATLTQKGVDLSDAKQISFSITEVSRSMGQDRATVCSELLGLQVNDRGTSRASGSGRSSVVVELSGLAFQLVVPGNLTCEMKEEAIELLREKIKDHEAMALEKLHLLHTILRQASKNTQDGCALGGSNDTSLLENIRQYFSADSLTTSDLTRLGVPVTTSTCEIPPEEEQLIGHDVRTLVSRFSSERFSGRSLARIFHGISSPCYPAIVWGAQRGFWRKYLHLDFHALCRVTTSYLVHTQNNMT